MIFSKVISAEDERDVLGILLRRSELFGQSFTESGLLKSE